MKLTPATKDDLPAIYASLSRNFVREELREYSDLVRLHGNGKFTLCHIEEDGVRKGFVGIWELDGFTFLEYLVVYENYRNGGAGGRALDFIEEKYGKVVLEAEPPIEPMQVRRMGFYKRHKMCVNPQEYYQPPYREGEDGCKLYLLSYPSLLSDFKGAVTTIYNVVYEREYK